MPLAEFRDPAILEEIVCKVRAISDAGGGYFHVTVELCARTVGREAGQLLIFCWQHLDARRYFDGGRQIPPASLAALDPNHGLDGLRKLLGPSGAR